SHSGFCQLVSAQLLVARSWYVCLNNCLPACQTGVPSLSPWTFPVPREAASSAVALNSAIALQTAKTLRQPPARSSSPYRALSPMALFIGTLLENQK
ncbi:hypothetical protein GBF38_003746, partial [Nibea albiflora]